jgi:putative glutamine amidotransferase
LRVSRDAHLPTPPRIGVTTYREQAAWGVWNEPADLLPASYAQSVQASGAAALLLPPGAVGTVDSVLDGLHGLLVAGGSDVDPQRYGAERDEHTGAPREDRDSWELALVGAALQRRLPVLAVCRGMQVLNVALGGDLIQHLPVAVGNDSHCPTVGVHGRHVVTLAQGSRAAAILGTQTDVATYHHQAVGRLGTGLCATGWAADATVEAVELVGSVDDGWCLGVQWHPEALAGSAIFPAFVRACVDYRAVVAS